jgi:acetolactate synthase-1/2/3 large subunit
MIVGGGGWSAETARRAQAFAEASALPVACSFRCQDYIDNRSSSYAGHLTTATDPALAQRVRDADVLLVVGDPLGEVTTGGYSLIEAPDPGQDLIHVHPDPRELGRVFAPAVSLLSGSGAFFEAIEPLDGGAWAQDTARARAAYEAWSVPEPGPWQLDLGLVVRQAASGWPARGSSSATPATSAPGSAATRSSTATRAS